MNRTILRTFGAVLFVIIGACNEPEERDEERTEPWLKDEAAQAQDKQPTYLRYRIKDGESLSFSLPTRKHKPTGKLTRLDGHVDFDLRDLVRSKGRIHFALDKLVMDGPSTNNQVEGAPEDRTTQALNWLGLGRGVDGAERSKNTTAVFEFDSLRAVSHTSAHIGSRKTKEGGGEQRRVYATANGELSLRGFSVQRQFSTTIVFHYADRATTKNVPERIEVTLRGSATLPLAEYEIAPRGPDGHLISEQKKLLGSEIGRDVKVTGTLELEKVGAR